MSKKQYIIFFTALLYTMFSFSFFTELKEEWYLVKKKYPHITHPLVPLNCTVGAAAIVATVTSPFPVLLLPAYLSYVHCKTAHIIAQPTHKNKDYFLAYGNAILMCAVFKNIYQNRAKINSGTFRSCIGLMSLYGYNSYRLYTTKHTYATNINEQ